MYAAADPPLAERLPAPGSGPRVVPEKPLADLGGLRRGLGAGPWPWPCRLGGRPGAARCPCISFSEAKVRFWSGLFRPQLCFDSTSTLSRNVTSTSKNREELYCQLSTTLVLTKKPHLHTILDTRSSQAEATPTREVLTYSLGRKT